MPCEKLAAGAEMEILGYSLERQKVQKAMSTRCKNQVSLSESSPKGTPQSTGWAKHHTYALNHLLLKRRPLICVE
eukprot:3789906-Rhodomonas_salina.1